ncbi:hypothetical protein FACS189443_3460 [Planctomycetales bacterium]|nr:hypothetical protein FACS189443_3460 [Planctomycetales bacterium]
MKIYCVVFLGIAFCCAASLCAEESAELLTKSSVWLGFPRHKIEELQNRKIKPVFLQQLRRQAVLIAAREECGAATRDVFFAEQPSKGSTKIADIDQFPGTDIEYTNHPQFLAELEKRSRSEFVAEWEKRGLKKQPLKKAKDGVVSGEITELLGDYADIPQWNAVRQLHILIREDGESLPRLSALVQGYAQLSFLTQNGTWELRQSLSARAMLYAQRAVAKYGETSETLGLRAAAWSLCAFPQIAKKEFEPLTDIKTAWFRLAKHYADYDFDKIEAELKKIENSADNSLGQLLLFTLTNSSGNSTLATLPFGEKVIKEIPNCGFLVQRTQAQNTFDLIQVRGSLFSEYLARRIHIELRNVPRLPDSVTQSVAALRQVVRKSQGGILGFGSEPHDFDIKEYYLKLAGLLKSLRETEISGEPSFQMLASLIEDREMTTVYLITSHLWGRNGYPETIFEPAKAALGSHPIFNYVGLNAREPSLKASYQKKVQETDVNYELVYRANYGAAQDKNPHKYSSDLMDNENFSDNIYVQPNSPRTIQNLIALDRIRVADYEKTLKKYAAFSNVREAIASKYFDYGFYEEIVALYRDDIQRELPMDYGRIYNYDYACRLLNKPDDAINAWKAYMETPDADNGLGRANAASIIGKIMLRYGNSDRGDFEDAEQYFQYAAATHSGWGLNGYGNYCELAGKLKEAEKLHQAREQSYPESGPFWLWSFYYRTNRSGLATATNGIVQRFERFSKAKESDNATKIANKIIPADYVAFSYCNDTPIPEFYSKQPYRKIFLDECDGFFGFLAYFDAVAKKDKQNAGWLLDFLRGKWWAQDGKGHFGYSEQGIHQAFKILAAMVESDQREPKPGVLNEAEVDNLLQNVCLDDAMLAKLLYCLGRYYEQCGETEKAKNTYRRVLSLRNAFSPWYMRSMAVKELRRLGMKKSGYHDWSRENPKIPILTRLLKYADLFARQHFRDYSKSPAESQLARPAAANGSVSFFDFGEAKPTIPGNYDVTKVIFRGETIPAEKIAILYTIYPNGWWRCWGTAYNLQFYPNFGERRPDGAYPLTVGAYDPVNAAGKYELVKGLAAFYDDHLVFVFSLTPGKEPTTLQPDADSDFVRVEMKKVFDETK